MALPLLQIDPDDEIFTYHDVAKNAKQSPRWAQKQFELGTIRTFKRGRESVTLKSWYHDFLRQLIAEESERQKELAG